MTEPHPRHVERIRKMKQRLAVRAWEYRQRNTSKGVWARLRGILALSERAIAVDEETAAALEASGHRPHPIGAQLEPPRRYFVLPPGEATSLSGRTIPVRLDTSFLNEPRVALVRFDLPPHPERVEDPDIDP